LEQALQILLLFVKLFDGATLTESCLSLWQALVTRRALLVVVFLALASACRPSSGRRRRVGVNNEYCQGARRKRRRTRTRSRGSRRR
jgi:hypothetical protein